MNARGLKIGMTTLAASLLAGGSLSAQASGACGANDGCQKAADLYAFLTPQLTAPIAGGNATLGQGGVLGGLGRFSIGVRATALSGELPDLESVDIQDGPAQASTFGIEDQVFGLPQVDVGVGLFRGIPLGLTNVGGVDLLVSASWLPDVEEEDFQMRATDGSYKFGFGARVGLLQESAAVPGVAVTYLRRGLPTVDVIAQVDDDTLAVRDAKMSVDSWRVVASKSFLAFGLAAGIGQDRSDAEATVSAEINNDNGDEISIPGQEFGQDLARTNAFVNLSLNLAVLRLVGEVGRVWGDEAPTYNSFQETSVTEPRLYGSVGLRLSF
jgi:hypothetical protein